jgi:predicted phosphodiesterase
MGNPVVDFDLEVTEAPARHSQIGIMADSHGRPEKIKAALDFFKARNCHCLFHLGDICDSTNPASAGDCIGPLQKFAVRAIRGNNDHLIEINHRDQNQCVVSADILKFLKGLPLVRKYQNGVFAHSLPFARELGLSSMVGMLGEREAGRFFSLYPRRILFRGHSHAPEVMFIKNNKILSRMLQPGERFDLQQSPSCVVSCGALTRNLCLVWRPPANVVECHRF